MQGNHEHAADAGGGFQVEDEGRTWGVLGAEHELTCI